MTITMRRIALGAAAGLLAIGVGAGAFVHAQDQTANPPARPSRGGPGAPGGRGGWFGGPGGPMGMLPMIDRELNLTDAQRSGNFSDQGRALDQLQSAVQAYEAAKSAAASSSPGG